MADLTAMLQAAAGAGEDTDPFFNQTTLLLHGDGTNGAQNNTFLDSSTTPSPSLGMAIPRRVLLARSRYRMGSLVISLMGVVITCLLLMEPSILATTIL
jgi:hypothetical protein